MIHVSTDQGASWSALPGPADQAWVGGYGAQAGRFWSISEQLGEPAYRGGGSSSVHSRPWIATVAMSDDDGAAWRPGVELLRTSIDTDTIGVALAADPSQTDRLFSCANMRDHDGEVRVSVDAGQSWMLAGANGPKGSRALAVGIDGKTLYANGTPGGVWRLALV